MYYTDGVVEKSEAASNELVNEHEVSPIRERVHDMLLAERTSLDLLHQPLHTLHLCIAALVHGSAIRCRSVLRSRWTHYVALPLIALLLTISLVVVPDRASTIFAAFDRDGDGQVNAADLEDYYHRVLGWHAGMGARAVAETFSHPHTSLNASQFHQWWRSGTASDVFRNEGYVADGWWREMEYIAVDALYWLVLGVLSSIGLGTGMHSGLLFLFPHIYLVCAARAACGDDNYWSYPRNPLYGPRQRAFVCLSLPPPSGRVDTHASLSAEPGAMQVSGAHSSASVWVTWTRVLPACMVWGLGTALGEIPPYAMSYAAALQGRHSAALEEKSAYSVLNYMRSWMMRTIRRYGFWAVLLLSSWPNMAFDLCGMACGQFLLPFTTFLAATMIGKGVIKVSLQALFFVTLFSGDNMERVLRRMGVWARRCLPAGVPVEGAAETVVQALLRARASITARASTSVRHTGAARDVRVAVPTSTSSIMTSEDAALHGQPDGQRESDNESWLMMSMHYMVVLTMLWFAKSIVESVALAERERRDFEVEARVVDLLTTRQSVDPSIMLTDDVIEQAVRDVHHR